MSAKVKRVDFTRKGKWLTMLFLAFLVYFCVIMINQQLSLRNLTSRQQEIQADIEQYSSQNELLKGQIELIETNPEYLEGLARKELGLVRDGETVYILPYNKN
ncbi:MAG: septum formation initiator family protein [Eubacteriales bacterium]|nr:septum formation initiator family protein [Eubacteriales bacterium]